MTEDNDLFLTDAEIGSRLAELTAPSSEAERRERRALRELVTRRAEQRSGSVTVAMIAHVVRNALVPALYHLGKLEIHATDLAPRVTSVRSGIESVLEWIDDLVRSHRS